MTFRLRSGAFVNGGSIPSRYTCDGKDVSPPLEWGDPPEGTRNLALVCVDLDAPGGISVHWVLYRIPVHARGLPEVVLPDAELADGSRHGRND